MLQSVCFVLGLCLVLIRLLAEVQLKLIFPFGVKDLLASESMYSKDGWVLNSL